MFRAPIAMLGIRSAPIPPRSLKSSSRTITPRPKNPSSGLLENAATPSSNRPRNAIEKVSCEFSVLL